jgi:hypothetical protein
MDIKDARKWVEKKQKALAKSTIKWKLSKEGHNLPDDEMLERQSEEVVKQANRIIKENGREAIKGVKSGLERFIKDRRS